MDYSLFLNHLSMPAKDEKEAYLLMLDALQGVLSLYDQNDRFMLYYDGDINSCLLAKEFTYQDFKEMLINKQELDLLVFIEEIEDKAPFIEHISDESVEELSELLPYFEDLPYEKNMDIFALAWRENGIIISLATDDKWQRYKLNFFISKQSSYKPINVDLFNISEKRHGSQILKEIRAKLDKDIEDDYPKIIFTEEFILWYKECKPEEKAKIANKIEHCNKMDFNIEGPIVETIRDSAFSNMKEIRVGNAHAQSGKIRVLFAMNQNRMPVILKGFIKHSNDYTEQIKIADELLKKYQTICYKSLP